LVEGDALAALGVAGLVELQAFGDEEVSGSSSRSGSVQWKLGDTFPLRTAERGGGWVPDGD
jgi:hypothetical protein